MFITIYPQLQAPLVFRTDWKWARLVYFVNTIGRMNADKRLYAWKPFCTRIEREIYVFYTFYTFNKWTSRNNLWFLFRLWCEFASFQSEDRTYFGTFLGPSLSPFLSRSLTIYLPADEWKSKSVYSTKEKQVVLSMVEMYNIEQYDSRKVKEAFIQNYARRELNEVNMLIRWNVNTFQLPTLRYINGQIMQKECVLWLCLNDKYVRIVCEIYISISNVRIRWEKMLMNQKWHNRQNAGDDVTMVENIVR